MYDGGGVSQGIGRRHGYQRDSGIVEFLEDLGLVGDDWD